MADSRLLSPNTMLKSMRYFYRVVSLPYFSFDRSKTESGYSNERLSIRKSDSLEEDLEPFTKEKAM